MRIEIVGQRFVMHRYAGVDDGKSTTVKIGSVPVTTRPDSVPDDVKDNLTPRELRELVDRLSLEHAKVVAQKAQSMLLAFDELLTSATSGALDAENTQRLEKSAIEFARNLRQVSRRNVGRVVLPSGSENTDSST